MWNCENVKPRNLIMHILIINGPNMNLLGKREPHLYGDRPFESYLQELRSTFADTEIEYRQSNHEGDLIDWLQEADGKADGIILNAAAYTHTSIAIRDAVAAISTPVIEVHLTDISQREKFRQISLLHDVCKASVMGKGLQGYQEAIEILKG